MAFAQGGEFPREQRIRRCPASRVEAWNNATRAGIGSQQFHFADPKAVRLTGRAEQPILLKRSKASDLQVRSEPSPHLVRLPFEPLRDEFDGSRAYDGRSGCLGVVWETEHGIPTQLHRASQPGT